MNTSLYKPLAQEGGMGQDIILTFSIALLVRPPLDPLLSFLPLGINALLGDAVLDASEAGAGVITLLARLLAVGACILDLPALSTGWLSGHNVMRERVHMHWHARVCDGMHCHLRLDGVGLGVRTLLVLAFLVGITHDGSVDCLEVENKGTRWNVEEAR